MYTGQTGGDFYIKMTSSAQKTDFAKLKKAHAANEYMSVRGLREFEKFVATLLHCVAEDAENRKQENR